MRYYVYVYLDFDDIPFYIGKGKRTRFKVQQHLYRSNSNNLLKHKIRKVGAANVKVRFLHRNLTEEEAFSREKYWIKHYGRRDLGTGTLCNLTDGGEGSSGTIISEDHKRAVSNANRGNQYSTGCKRSVKTKRKLSVAAKGKISPMKGKKMPETVKRRISAIQKGRKHSEEVKQKISAAGKGRKNAMYGKHHSEETKQKMSKSLKDRFRRKQEIINNV